MAQTRIPASRKIPGVGSSSGRDTFLAARVVNMILGGWLFISAFAWPHSAAQYTNTWVVGLLCVLFAGMAFVLPWVRYVNAGLAIWLFISAFVLPQASLLTLWNNALVAIAIFIVSLIPAVGEPITLRPRRRQPV